MIRASRPCSRPALLLGLLAAATSAGCSREAPAALVAPNVAAGGTPTRLASVVDPPSEVPAGAAVGDGKNSVQSLVPPLPSRAALDLVRAFFRAITDENVEALATLLSPDATVPSKARTTSSTMVDHWRGRMNHLRYQALGTQELYAETEVETYRFQDWEGGALVGRLERPQEMAPSDLLVRVPMRVVRSGTERVFGDDIVLLLRPQQGRLTISEQFEDFVLQ